MPDLTHAEAVSGSGGDNKILRDPADLDATGILNWCEGGSVPVNTDLDAAMEAHRMASPRLHRFTLRAVILATTPDVTTAQRQIDYLAALPESDWSEAGRLPAAELREEQLLHMRSYVTARASEEALGDR